MLINSIFSSGAVTNSIVVQSGGGLRIVNNKINHNQQGNGIAILPNVVTTQAISPFFIQNNSIEGCVIGILFQRPAGVTEQVGNVLITGNEIIGNNIAINMQNSGTNPTVPWILGGVINGNFIYAGSGGFGMNIGGATGFNIVGNQLNGPGSTGLFVDGTSTSLIGQFGNNKGASVT
ncbi:Right handed beta helix region [Bradyrhizobium erythrophlei]|uniref:Right handed beta helix region n=2 Tax=Bradyrhizobium erythrophlei TaxID=1437360 RepID=A0A1M5T8E4_9BRAD|nr:Right handed beta helix region [Bradyrhizobium erythrophlei]